jgi:hypothetical protein
VSRERSGPNLLTTSLRFTRQLVRLLQNLDHKLNIIGPHIKFVFLFDIAVSCQWTRYLHHIASRSECESPYSIEAIWKRDI